MEVNDQLNAPFALLLGRSLDVLKQSHYQCGQLL